MDAAQTTLNLPAIHQQVHSGRVLRSSHALHCLPDKREISKQTDAIRTHSEEVQPPSNSIDPIVVKRRGRPRKIQINVMSGVETKTNQISTMLWNPNKVIYDLSVPRASSSLFSSEMDTFTSKSTKSETGKSSGLHGLSATLSATRSYTIATGATDSKTPSDESVDDADANSDTHANNDESEGVPSSMHDASPSSNLIEGNKNRDDEIEVDLRAAFAYETENEDELSFEVCFFFV